MRTFKVEVSLKKIENTFWLPWVVHEYLMPLVWIILFFQVCSVQMPRSVKYQESGECRITPCFCPFITADSVPMNQLSKCSPVSSASP